MLIARLHRCRLTKEDPYSFAHDRLAIEDLTDPNRRVDVVERDHDPSEGF